MGWLSPESSWMRGANDVVDAIWINILMAVTSIPVVTIGAALSAGHDAARRSLAGEGHVTANYFMAFRENLVKATLLWLPYLAVAIGLLYAWVVLQITPLLVPKFALSMLWIIGFEWTFALQARFENGIVSTWRNAFVFGISKIGYTVTLAAIDVAFVALLVGSWLLMPQGLFLLLVFGYGAIVMLHVPILEHALRAYTASK